MGRGSKEIEELGYDVLDAIGRGELSSEDGRVLVHKHSARSRTVQTIYRKRLRETLGPGDPIVEAFDGLVRTGSRRKHSVAQTIRMLDPNRRSPAEWADKTAEGQKRAWASGKRKPFPEDQGERVSRGILASRKRRKASK
ncbi:hypothetical protein IID21_03325 [Patescibacteria group bacterium]|nr:hypothetical protein [Patescibacteria group bacterium]